MSSEEQLMLRLIDAINNNDYLDVKRCLNLDVNTNFYFIAEKLGHYDNTPLMLAAKLGERETIIELLIAHNADIDWANKYGATALMLAADHGKNVSVNLLLQKGADPNINRNWGGTALHWAARRGHKNIVHNLLKYGADPTIKNKRNMTPAEFARDADNEEIAVLLEHAENKWKKLDSHTVLHRQLPVPDMGITSIFNFSSMSVTKIFKHFDIETTRTIEMAFSDDRVGIKDIIAAKEALISQGGAIEEDKLKYQLLRKKKIQSNKKRRRIVGKRR